MVRRIGIGLALGVVAVAAVAALWIGGLRLGWFGQLHGAGEPQGEALPDTVVVERERSRQRAGARLSPAPSGEILFGDLHVHTTFSPDAFLGTLPMMGGDGGMNPVGEACDYARYCSALDFWSINDHAEASTPRKWAETVEAIRTCNALAGDPENPDVAAFLGWEWSQVGSSMEGHYGHKNVVLKGLADDEIPTRAIGAGGLATEALRGEGLREIWKVAFLDPLGTRAYADFSEFVSEIQQTPPCAEGVPSPDLPDDCYEKADTPRELFEKLDQWGHDAIVIPHGNTWGFYSPQGITWDKQLEPGMHDPDRQILVEVYSGHGNSEEYRPWRGAFGTTQDPVCPEPSDGYVPECWRAGEIIEARCREAGEPDEECAARAAEARTNFLRIGPAGHLTVPGVEVTDWLGAGQCLDCFQPSQAYRPGGSSQYALSVSDFSGEEPERFRWGFIASSDNHTARPGTGFKELDRRRNTDAAGVRNKKVWEYQHKDQTKEARSRSLTVEEARTSGLGALYMERQASFFTTGGLAAVHSAGRSRDAIWDAMQRREVYGTSGDRILLWFNLLNAERPDGSFGAVPMGGEARMGETPRFEARAVGAFKQKPGCPDYAVRALSPERLQDLCAGECDNPSDERKLITRIEVVRIRPQIEAGEPVGERIEDPWRVLECPPSQAGCVVQFEDPDFLADGRPSLYYVRAIEEPEPMINAGNLRCTFDEQGRCVEVDPCYGDWRTPAEDDCLAESEPRAWSSPIYVDPPAAPAADLRAAR
jgi:hypothetical protein